MSQPARDTAGASASRWRIAKDVIDSLAVAGFLYLLYAAFAYKAAYINQVYGPYAGCTDCFTRSVFAHDGAMLGFSGLLYLGSLWLRWYPLAVFVRLLALLLATAFVADVVIFQSFTTRLKPSDFFVYGDQFKLLWDHMSSTVDNFQPLFYAVLVAALLMLFLPSAGGQRRLRWSLPGLALLLPVTVYAYQMQPLSYAHDWAMRNILTDLMSRGVTTAYSEGYVSSLPPGDPYDQGLDHCPLAAGKRSQPDIVVLVLESWSAYQSDLWGGLGNDWTPRLDALARENVWYSNYYAGGFSTNEGLMSIMHGTQFFSPVKSYLAIGLPFEGHWNWEDSLASTLSRAGYHTGFLTSGDLSFSLKGDWLENLGFDYIEGHDHPDYDGLPRSHFRSAPDDALYRRTLDYYRQERDTRSEPIMLVVENVSSHLPFIHPYTGERDAEAVFRYMDETAYDFYLALREGGFFAGGGQLLVTSDHRAMIPIGEREAAVLGQSAASRVPAFLVADDQLPREVTALAHQADILPSLLRRAAGSPCVERDYTDLLASGPVRSECVFHARGDNRDLIDVFCPDGAAGQVTLDGDDTRFTQARGIAPQEQRALVQRLNRARLALQARHVAFRERQRREG